MPAKSATPNRHDPPAWPGEDAGPPVPYAQRSEALLRARVEWESALVLSLAAEIEADADAALRWFRDEGIREFGGKTAAQLVQEGATTRLLGMLAAIRSGRRGA